ncbi:MULTISPECIES: hypothetical protein [Neobacillus]|uniref:Uncharacterized protein n=1 Tax=Neobacillus rhizophilus TaxID=2833579 RepID=A0A942U070_9BACI|nr:MULTISPECIES: hypothetical protein [Neobacillus]MBS4212095.1 hypothetical protein [Neobacillus rhizophilus]MBU8915526.1 hypothetical protein [Bacillus sp. FJAT-29953]
MSEKNEKELEVEVNVENQLSSLELIWKIGFDELDAWANRFNKRDELFLSAVKNYVESVKRNQDNLKAVTEQFNREVKEWEKAAREELLVTTTTLQHFFPVKSYEEINKVVDDIQQKTAALLLTPVKALTGGQALDKYLDAVAQYLAFRKKAREKYIDSVKKTTNVLYENQKIFVDLFSKQLKAAIFPFQKFMKNAVESTKS